MKPFNAELAKQGKPVMTESGIVIEDFHWLPSANKFIGVIKSSVYTWHSNGKYCFAGGSPFDLLMAPEKKTVWINHYTPVGMNPDLTTITSCGFPSKEIALKNANKNHSGYIGTFPTEIEV